jgi:hypothetical protein
LVYTWTGDSAGTRTFAQILADAGTTTTLGKALAELAGECNSNDKAIAALLTGASFTGTSGKVITSNIQCHMTYTLSTSAKYPGFLTATDDGGTNNPQLTITAEAASEGILYITHVHSVVQ